MSDRDEDRAQRQPDQHREDEVAARALLDALIGLIELRTRVRDLVLEVIACGAHLGLEVRATLRRGVLLFAPVRRRAGAAARGIP